MDALSERGKRKIRECVGAERRRIGDTAGKRGALPQRTKGQRNFLIGKERKVRGNREASRKPESGSERLRTKRGLVLLSG